MLRLHAFFAASILIASCCTAQAQSQRELYTTATQSYDEGNYDQSCKGLRQLYTSTDGFRDLSKFIIELEKRTGTSGEWQTKAFDSDNRHKYAKECGEWYRAAILQAGFGNFNIAANDDEYAGRAVKNLEKLRLDENERDAQSAKADAQPAPPPDRQQSAKKQNWAEKLNRRSQRMAQQNEPAASDGQSSIGQSTSRGCASDTAMQRNVRLVDPCVQSLMAQAREQQRSGALPQARETYQRAKEVNGYAGFQKDFAVENEATKAIAAIESANQPRASAASPGSGHGLIPDGEYACYDATTATILQGGSARLNPGSWHGTIVVRGNTYQIGDNPAGPYSVDANGRITWNGGAYSSKTLGRYVIDNGTPTIVIGWAGTDAGLACRK